MHSPPLTTSTWCWTAILYLLWMACFRSATLRKTKSSYLHVCNTFVKTLHIPTPHPPTHDILNCPTDRKVSLVCHWSLANTASSPFPITSPAFLSLYLYFTICSNVRILSHHLLYWPFSPTVAGVSPSKVTCVSTGSCLQTKDPEKRLGCIHLHDFPGLVLL